MTNTSSKLNEAKFFNNLLKEHYSKYPDFNYYLNAFLSSARAVTWVMKNEYGKIKGYQKWFDNEEPSQEIKELLEKINSLRVQTNKIKPVRANPNVLFTIDETSITDKIKNELKKVDKKRVTFTISESNEENVENVITFRGKFGTAFNSVDEFPHEDIIAVCDKYVTELDRLVNICESKFKHLLPETEYKGVSIKFTNGDILK